MTKANGHTNSDGFALLEVRHVDNLVESLRALNATCAMLLMAVRELTGALSSPTLPAMPAKPMRK